MENKYLSTTNVSTKQNTFPKFEKEKKSLSLSENEEILLNNCLEEPSTNSIKKILDFSKNYEICNEKKGENKL